MDKKTKKIIPTFSISLDQMYLDTKQPKKHQQRFKKYLLDKQQPKETKMERYRIEVQALKIIDVEATSKEDAIKKAKERGLNCETTKTENWSKDIQANYHYEDYDFNNAEVSKS